MLEDRLHAVLIEPQLQRFREVFGLEDAQLEVSFEGYHRYASLAEDRVFLIHRNHTWVAGMRREAAVLGPGACRNLSL